MAAANGSGRYGYEQKHYILLKDHRGSTKGLPTPYPPTYTSQKFATIIRGEILTKLPELHQPADKTMMIFSPWERPSYNVACPRTDVQELDKEETDLLLPICSMGARLRVLQERDKLQSGKKMRIGSDVWVVVTVNRVPRTFKGVVRYKGPLPGYRGTMFGVEIVVGSKIK